MRKIDKMVIGTETHMYAPELNRLVMRNGKRIKPLPEMVKATEYVRVYSVRITDYWGVTHTYRARRLNQLPQVIDKHTLKSNENMLGFDYFPAIKINVASRWE
jgi:hypothetical protein